MLAWPATPLPALPGVGLAVRVWDSSSGSLHGTGTGAVGLYVCGITPYDATHMGHAATYVAFDLLHRAWLDGGRTVSYVQNVTDVDDPLLERARQTGEDWVALAQRETELFRQDMAALAVLPPRHFVGAVEAIPQVVSAVRGLLERGAAYDVDGDIYFAVHADSSFGAVSNLSEAEMVSLFAERGGDPERPGKKHPLDCVLWRGARAGEPAWDSDLGPGRPGWHVECTAIALEHLGVPFEVQGGGSDLAFPHHEMGAAHGQVLTGRTPYARSYVHAGMVGLDGAKMSKSKGNLVFVSRLRAAGADPTALRLALLAHHYRSDWEWTQGVLDEASSRLQRWRQACGRPTGPAADAVLSRVRERLAADLDAPGAVQVVDGWVSEQLAAGGEDPEAPSLVARTVDALLGVPLAAPASTGEAQAGESPPRRR